MPKITAPTVAEHRARQQSAILAAARDLLHERGYGEFTFGALAERVGLARASIYEYFRSKDDIVAALCEESMPQWVEQVQQAMARTRTPRGRIAAFIRTQLELVAAGKHRLAVQLAGVPLHPEALRRIQAVHQAMLPPLVDALARLGHPDPTLAARLVQGVVNEAALRIEAGDPASRVIGRAVDLVLDGLATGPPRARA